MPSTQRAPANIGRRSHTSSGHPGYDSKDIDRDTYYNTELNKIQTERDRYQSCFEQASKKLSDTHQANGDLKTQLHALNAEVAELQRRIQAYKDANDVLNRQNEVLGQEYAALEARYHALAWHSSANTAASLDLVAHAPAPSSPPTVAGTTTAALLPHRAKSSSRKASSKSSSKTDRDREREMEREREREREKEKEKEKEKERERESQRDRERDRDGDRQRHRERDRERDRKHDRERHKEKERESKESQESQPSKEYLAEKERLKGRFNERKLSSTTMSSSSTQQAQNLLHHWTSPSGRPPSTFVSPPQNPLTHNDLQVVPTAPYHNVAYSAVPRTAALPLSPALYQTAGAVSSSSYTDDKVQNYQAFPLRRRLQNENRIYLSFKCIFIYLFSATFFWD